VFVVLLSGRVLKVLRSVAIGADVDFDTWIGNADEALNSGDVGKAVSALRWASRGQGMHERPGELVVLARRLLRAARLADMDQLVRFCSAVILDPDDGQGLYDLGWQLNEVGLTAIAVPMLRRLQGIAPNQGPLVAELITALEGDGQHDGAVQVLLAEAELLSDFRLRYLLVFNAFMSANVDVALEHLEALEAIDDGQRFMLLTVRSMAERYGRTKGVFTLSNVDVRGWHFVLNGGLLLHLSSAGFAEGMHGRYAFVQGSLHAMRAGLERCTAVFERWGYSPEIVLYLPDLGSRALAQAAASLWGVGCEAYSAGAVGCVVANDLDALDREGQASLRARPAGQVLYVHNAKWTSPPAFTPDVLYMLSQHLVALWEPQMRLGDDGQMAGSEPSDEPASYWAEQILGADVEVDQVASGDSVAELLALAGSVGAPSGLERSRFWEGGPVSSNRFA
jgi:hypothetical protein